MHLHEISLTLLTLLFFLELESTKSACLNNDCDSRAKTSFDKNFKKHSKREIPALKESLESADTRSSYLEENDNSLYGSDTPIFMAKRNKSVEDPESPYYIEYHQKPFVISSAQIIESIPYKKREAKSAPLSDNVSNEVHNEPVFSWSDNDGNRSNFSSNLSLTLNENEDEKRSIDTKQNPVPNVVYIKVLVVIDRENFELHRANLAITATYISSLMNGVDLRFRQMNNPKVRLNLAGIIIPEDESAVPYLKHPSWFDSYKRPKLILPEMDTYFSNVFPQNLCSYDIVLSMVKNPLISETPYRGPSFYLRPDAWPSKPAVAVVSDTAGLNSIMQIVRTFGFIFGSKIDDTYDCSANDGFIMQRYIDFDQRNFNGLFFSECSLKSMQEYLGHNSHYLTEKPNIKTPLPKNLPGKIFNRNEQCNRFKTGYLSNRRKEKDCLNLYCEDCENIVCFRVASSFYPAEGSSCGIGKICLNGTCVHE